MKFTATILLALLCGVATITTIEAKCTKVCVAGCQFRRNDDKVKGKAMVCFESLPLCPMATQYYRAPCNRHGRLGFTSSLGPTVLPRLGVTWDEMDDDEYVGWGDSSRMKKILNGRGPGWDEMDEMDEDDESVGGWVKVAGGLIGRDLNRGVANGECNGRCQRRLRRMRFLSKCTKICVANCSGAGMVRFGKVMRCYESLPICKRTGNKKKPWSVSGRKNDYRACRTPKRRN